ncbi:hypothetical protein BDK51DRAFT_20603 [Blyttiomyces helicus]|uniref:CNNM transmembrane domain-containing protein n=1 Tax=Blyttiomyces helicus TaxID=388810 RepID=A0A4P9WEE9_9FUNG|nr:hypothetical protein BDK51DRAFT_20603 [Blyttiomyces helicus]|eukprot:RKO91099.1 hypothetical protein BDK51DRAFT_20603 [Blyttiomyces helicus]
MPALQYWSFLVAIGVLVIAGGIFAGLTIGLMSLDETNLAILKLSGTVEEKAWAARIEPIRRNGHLLLVTLLLANTVINETLPVLMHSLKWDGYKAVLISTALIVVFGEIIPQAICARYGLQVGAFFAYPVRILIWVVYIIAYPIARLLDWILGHKHGVIYRRSELKELMALHGEDQEGPLTKDEVSVLRAVLELRDKSVLNVMTSLEHVFMLPLETKLDRPTMENIMKAGHSRVPIYASDRGCIIGVVLVKQLIINDPDDAIPLSDIKIRRLPRVTARIPLFEMLHVFEQGGSHMAVVYDSLPGQTEQPGESSRNGEALARIVQPTWTYASPRQADSSGGNVLGIVTLEDIIEELLGEEVRILGSTLRACVRVYMEITGRL